MLPVYNRSERIEAAIQSVLNQNFTDWELIIVDDASTDNTWNILQTFRNDKVKLLRNEQNQERCITRNKGIHHAAGEYITFIDSDDHHLPNHLDKLHKFIVSKGQPTAFFFTNAFNETESGVRSKRTCPNFELYDPFVYFLRYTVNPQRWAIHKDVMKKNLFDPKINICEDMDVSLRIVNSGVPVYQLNNRTTCYVAAEDSFTLGDSRKWERELEALQKIFKRQELKFFLPLRERWRLLSMCHFHLATKEFNESQSSPFWKHALLSLFMYPLGYNGKTTWPLIVMIVYKLPVLGRWIRGIRNKGA